MLECTMLQDGGSIKLITDKIKETDFNGIKYGSELSDNASSSKVEIAESDSNLGGVKSSDKNLTVKIKRPMLR